LRAGFAKAGMGLVWSVAVAADQDGAEWPVLGVVPYSFYSMPDQINGERCWD